MAEIDNLFQIMVTKGASDLHLAMGNKPMLRLHGSMETIEEWPVLEPEYLANMLDEITPEANRKQFEKMLDTDFAYEQQGLGRFRANLFMDRQGVGAVFRLIPSEILTAEKLGLPEAICNLTTLSKGLVLVTGPTGSGKSTTLCAMIDLINRTRQDHIITIEDPIEFVHSNQRCLINQREVFSHTMSFKNALRAALREDPDILLVGELRDLETMEIAIETAETGHLVFGTLHTTTAASTVDRIIDQFPANKQSQVRSMLAGSLKGVIAQTLCKRADGRGRVAALEVLIATTAVSALIRDGKTHQIPSAMQTGLAHGMVLLNDALTKLVADRLITKDEAIAKSVDRESLEKALEGLRDVPSSRAVGAARPAATRRPAATTPSQKGLLSKLSKQAPAEKPMLAKASFDDFAAFRAKLGR